MQEKFTLLWQELRDIITLRGYQAKRVVLQWLHQSQTNEPKPSQSNFPSYTEVYMLGLRLEKTVAWRYFEIHTFFIWASSLKMAGKNIFLETDTVSALAFRSYKCCLQRRIACMPMEMDFYGLVRGPRYRFKKQNKKQCSTCCSSLATTSWSGTSIGALGHLR